MMVPLKYLSSVWRTLQISLINHPLNLDLNWSKKYVIIAAAVANQQATFSITDWKLYVPSVTLSTQDNTKLLTQLKSGFKRTIILNKYQSKISTERLSQYLDYLVDPGFQIVNRLFVFSFEDEAQQTSYKRYYIGTVEIKDYNVMTNGRNVFDQPARDRLRKYYSVQKIAIGEGDDYTTNSLFAGL